MIGEDSKSKLTQHYVELPSNKLILLVKECMVETVKHFKEYLKLDFHNKINLNENDLTQEYTKQAQILIRKMDFPFNIEGQYQDVYNQSKGFSDFFFYLNEQGVELCSIYSVESKRLPLPSNDREKEYVIKNNKGGIERYKTEKHGKGLNKCGLLGFIEEENPKHWNLKINEWIEDLANKINEWETDETLTEIESNIDYSILESIAHRKNDDIELTHLWIVMK